MRLRTLIAFCFCGAAASAFADDFSGAWVAWICPAGVLRASGRCANFVLELHQKDGRLCGAHFFSTAGAERVDEGGAPSVLGEIDNGTATVAVTSTRAVPPVRVRVEMKKTDGLLRWLRLENPSGDYLLPQAVRLSKSGSKTLFAPLFEQALKAACSSAFAMADQQAARESQGRPSGDSPSLQGEVRQEPSGPAP